MGVGVSVTAFGRSLTSLSWRRTRPGRHHAITFLPALLLATILPGCASVDVHMLSSQTFTPQASTVEILEQAPSRPYVQIAFLTVNSGLLSEDSRREKIVEKALELGADAVVFGALRPLAPASSNRTAEQSAPPAVSPPANHEKVMPNDLQSSLEEGVLDGEVSVYLVGGGGGR